MNARKLAAALRLAAEALDDELSSYVILPRASVVHGDLPCGPGVYFLVDGDVIKVGYASNVKERIGNHRTSNLRAYPFAVVEGDPSTESRIHGHLAGEGLRLKQDREWFHFQRREVERCIAKYTVLWRPTQ